MPYNTRFLPESLVRELHPTKNLNIDPAKITYQSNKKLWWVCKKNHEWAAHVFSRANGAGCRVCANREVLVGYNDLASHYPQFAAEWDYSKNRSLPSEIVMTSNILVHWICPQNHNWNSRLSSRTKRAAQCPQCSGRKASSTKNLKITHPSLSVEWHPVKNGNLHPENVIAGTERKVWWLGKKCKHEWQAQVSNRANGTGCPICANRVVITGVNDLATTQPQVFKLIDLDENSTIDFTVIHKGSPKVVSWQGENCNHKWKRKVSSQVQNNVCPLCSGSQIIPGISDLATTHPLIASELMYEKSKIRATALHANSSRAVWWLCNNGHEWTTSPGRRTQSNAQCQYCSNSFVLAGFNDFATKNPKLLSEWDIQKNLPLMPHQITRASRVAAWWLCNAKQHSWQALISSRVVLKSGCPFCSQSSTSKAETEIKNYLEGLGLKVEQSNRNILPNRFEIDLWIPSHNLGIEYNGLYWHSEEHGKDKTYHYNKWLAAKKAGVQLIQVWEDDWILRKEVILRALAHKLGVSAEAAATIPLLANTPSRVYARKTRVETLTTKQAREFLEVNHIQGYASGSYYLGLMDDNALLRAVIVLKKEAGNVLNIVRYATNGTVVGGFTKLLKHAELAYQPASFITFADHMISDGGLYENNGFVADKELAPDYMYVVGSQRKHKFGYRLIKFKTDSSLIWQDGLTEAELAKLNGLPRIWDAGKTRYRKTVHFLF